MGSGTTGNPSISRTSGRSRIRYLQTAAWLVPGVVLFSAGLLKLADPSGIAPQALAGLANHVPYTVIQRLLGLLEIGLAVLLFHPRLRGVGRVAALATFAGFSVFVASNAHDLRFVENCGCFGGLPGMDAWGPLHGWGLILVRNSALCGLILLGAFLAGSGAFRPGMRIAGAAAAGALLLAATSYLAEHHLRQRQITLVAASRVGMRRARFPGWSFPDIPLLDARGLPTTSAAVLRGKDHLLFFSPSCPHCRRQAPTWSALHRRLVAEGGRLVLLSVDEPEAVAAFKVAYGCEEIPHYVVARRMDLYLLGIEDIPQLVALGEGREVVFHKLQVTGDTFSGAVTTASRRVPGLQEDAWGRVAAAIFGAGTVLGGGGDQAGGRRAFSVRTPVGAPATLFVAWARSTPIHTIELAVGLDSDGVIRGMIPLTLDGYARVVDPDAAFCKILTGLPLAQAVERAQKLAEAGSLEAPVWSSVGALLQDLAEHASTKSE